MDRSRADSPASPTRSPMPLRPANADRPSPHPANGATTPPVPTARRRARAKSPSRPRPPPSVAPMQTRTTGPGAPGCSPHKTGFAQHSPHASANTSQAAPHDPRPPRPSCEGVRPPRGTLARAGRFYAFAHRASPSGARDATPPNPQDRGLYREDTGEHVRR